MEGEWWRGSVTGWKGGESEGLEVSWTYLMVMMPTPVSRPMRIHSCQNSSLVRRAKPVMSRQCELSGFLLCLLAASSSISTSPGSERSEDVSVEERGGSSSSVGCGWYIIGGDVYTELLLQSKEKKGIRTDFLRGEHGRAVLGAGLVQEVRVAASALVGGEHGVRGAGLVVDDDEEGDGDEDDERGGEREHGEEPGGVAGEGDAGDEGVEEGAEPEGCQGKGRRRPAVRRPIQGCCFQCGLECSTAADSSHEGVEGNHANGHGPWSAVVGCEGQLSLEPGSQT